MSIEIVRTIESEHIIEAFDRGEDFDLRDGTIVRVQTRNWWTRLSSHYENPTELDTVRLVLPKGLTASVFK